MGKEMSSFIAILVLVVIGYAIVFAGSVKVTDNLAAKEYAAARIEEARAQQERAIQEARTAVEQARQDNATQRADSRNITLAAIAGMVISQAGGGNWILPLALGAALGLLAQYWRDRQPRG